MVRNGADSPEHFDRALAGVAEPRTRTPEKPPGEETVPDLPTEKLSGQTKLQFSLIPRRQHWGLHQRPPEEVYNWVLSDGQLRRHDEIADEMFAALLISRRGSTIESVLRDTIRARPLRWGP